MKFEALGNEAYLLSIDHVAPNCGGKVISELGMSFTAQNCLGTPRIQYGFDNNLFNQEEWFMHPVVNGPSGTHWVPDPNAPFSLTVVNYVDTFSRWDTISQTCINGADASYSAPALQVQMDFDYPLHVEIQ